MLFRVVCCRSRVLFIGGLVLLIAGLTLCRGRRLPPAEASSSPAGRGRLVYISQGCIRCHSTHVHPETRDLPMQHQARVANEAHDQHAPDLSQVGARRSALWLKMHLYDPGEVSGVSVMPSYAFLFRDGRGNDLVAYLSSLGSGTDERLAQEQGWQLPHGLVAAPDTAAGEKLYRTYCATCHSIDGRTRLKWQSEFTESPAILQAGAVHSGESDNPESPRVDHLAQIIKFGIPNSDMAGHENLSDKDIASLSLWLAHNHSQPPRNQ